MAVNLNNLDKEELDDSIAHYLKRQDKEEDFEAMIGSPPSSTKSWGDYEATYITGAATRTESDQIRLAIALSLSEQDQLVNSEQEKIQENFVEFVSKADPKPWEHISDEMLYRHYEAGAEDDDGHIKCPVCGDYHYDFSVHDGNSNEE